MGTEAQMHYYLTCKTNAAASPAPPFLSTTASITITGSASTPINGSTSKLSILTTASPSGTPGAVTNEYQAVECWSNGQEWFVTKPTMLS